MRNGFCLFYHRKATNTQLQDDDDDDELDELTNSMFAL